MFLFSANTSELLLYCLFQAPCYPDMYEGLGNGIAFDQTAGLVAVRTENYSIQFYSLFDDRGISEVRIFLHLLLILIGRVN